MHTDNQSAETDAGRTCGVDGDPRCPTCIWEGPTSCVAYVIQPSEPKDVNA